MRYNLHSILWISLISAVIGILAFYIPVAEADERKLRLELSSIDDIYAVPGLEVPVDLTINDGSFTDGDLVTSIQITLDYDSSVATIEEPSTDIEIHAAAFGIEIGTLDTQWGLTISDTPLVGELAIIMSQNHPFSSPTLQVPQPGGLPEALLTITFTVQTFDVEAVTDLEFINDSHTFFARQLLLDKLLLDEAISGRISFVNTPSTEVTLSLPSLSVFPPVIGDEVLVDLTVVGGYMDEDLIDAIKITIAYDSTVVDINDPPVVGTDIQTHLDLFGITSGWQTLADIRDDLTPPDHPELDKQIQIQMRNTNPSSFPALGEPDSGSFPEDLLTIAFTVQSDNPQDKTLLFFVDEDNSSFGRRDQPKRLPVNPVHGGIALPVELSALGAIWHPNGAKIFWEAESQQGNLGWNIYRSETKDGKFVKINGELIKGAGTTANPMKYSFIDRDAEKGKVYYYHLEDISFSGEKHRTDPIKSIPVNKNISWGDIKSSALR
jgi:hypothetical protein